MSRRVAMIAAQVALGAALTGCAGTAAGAAGTAGHARGAPPSSTGVSIRDFAFRQQAVTVAEGTTVTWTNQDSSIHTVTADDHSYDSGHLAQAGSFRHAFRSPGTYRYHCDIHQFMTGTVIVTG